MFERTPVFRSALRLAGAALLALLAAVPPARAQSTATVQGSVTDEQGAVVPNAKVVARQVATGLERETQTSAAGEYVFSALPAGVYRLEVRADGFKTKIVDGLEVEVARSVVQNLTLAVGSHSEEATVSADAPLVELGTAAVGQVIDQRTVQQIPLNGRHFVDLGLLIPGSVTPPQNGFLTAPLRGQGSFAFNTAGNREDTVNFMINGVNLNDQAQNQITFQPSINTVQEFKVDNSTFSAEYGRSSGAIVNIATRSGSNDFHGEAFEFLRNQSLDAANVFSTKKSPFRRNQFGANVSGPIAKNRTFFFVTYEGLRQRQGLDVNSGVLTDAERAGVTDPISRRLLDFIPSANSGTNRFVGAATAPVDIDQWTGDLSHSLAANDTLHAYYAFQHDKRVEPTLQGNTVPGFGDTRESRRQIGTLNETHVFGPTLVNEARFGFNRIKIDFTPNTELDPSGLGIGVGGNGAIGLPQISIATIGLNFGGPGGFPQGRTDTTTVFSDTLSWVTGRHSFKFGGEWRRFDNVNYTLDTGTFNFGSVADFQAGRGNAFAITLGDRASEAVQSALGLFVQDRFRPLSNLTLELGLRYDWNMTPTEKDDRFVVFDPATDTLASVGASRGGDIYGQNHNLEPRLGIVWDPWKDGRTSVRAAYALLVDQPVTNVVTPTASNPPLATPLTFAGTIGLAGAAATAGPAGLAPQTVSPDFTNARVHSFNVNVQRELGRDMSVMIGYFGSRGVDLRISRNINQLVNGVRPFAALAASSPILPGRTLGNITEIDSAGKSWYDSMWVSATRRLSHGLQLNASYTLSKSEDYNSLNSQGVVIQDSTNIAGDKGPSDYDARHRFVLSALYALPFKGNGFVEGWELGAVTQAQSGNPINVVTNVGTFTGVANTLRPDLIGDPAVLGSADQWFANGVCDPRIAGSCTSASVFALPVSASGQFHFGNLPRNAIIGPAFFNTDVSLTKRTKLRGSAGLEIRLEVFDVFNHPNLGQPGRIATVGSTSFGIIRTTRFPTGDSGSSRQIQLAMKLLF